MATKTETYKNVMAEVLALEIPKGKMEMLQAILDEHLKPKVATGATPPKLDKDGNIIEAWCRYHKRYEVVENMVISAGKSKGYCKAGIAAWNRAGVKIKRLQEEMTRFMGDGDFEEAQKCAIDIKEMSANRNNPDNFDFDKDWATFNAGKSDEL